MQESSLTPVPAARRTLSGIDVAAIWFGAAIVISECWAGGLPSLAGLGLGAGLVAIVLGRVVGNGLMGAMAGIGADSGLPTMVLTRPAFGVRGSLLPAFLNLAQLVGWTAWMYFVAYLYLDVLAKTAGLIFPAGVWIGVLAVLCTVASFAGAELWAKVLKVLAVGMLGLTVWMTVLIFRKFSPGEVFAAPAAGGTSLLAGTDLVVAMSVSWLPLVADYSRFGKSVRGSALGTFWGYFVGGTWMYAVGLLVAVAGATTTPDQIVVATMSEAGKVPVLLGILLVLVSTVTTTFLDIYSAVVSAQNVWPKLPVRVSIVVVGIGSAVLAGFLDVFQFEPFLLAIGAVFLPIFTIVLLDRFVLARGRVDAGEIDRRGGRYWYSGGFRVTAVLAWAVGFVVYDLAQGFPSASLVFPRLGREPWSSGASLPCIGATAAAWVLLSLLSRRRR